MVYLNTIQNIPYVQATDTVISLDQAIERQVWVKDYKRKAVTSAGKK